MKITTVYHWSPSKNKESILKNGIKIGMSIHEYTNAATKKLEAWSPPYICTSPDPNTALIYVEPTFDEEVPSLDLFQVNLLDSDEIVFRNDRTNRIIEVRLHNTIPPDRVKYLATRK